MIPFISPPIYRSVFKCSTIVDLLLNIKQINELSVETTFLKNIYLKPE